MKIKDQAVNKQIETYGLLGFKYVKKAKSLSKKVIGIVELLAYVPPAFDELFLALKSFKIISGMLAVPKLKKNIIKIFKPNSAINRILSVWAVVKSSKKIVGAVETVFTYLKKLNVLTKADLAWTKVTGYIFLPVTFISAVVSGYKFGKQVEFYVHFAKRVKVVKNLGAPQLCQELLDQEKKLRKFKVVTKQASLKPQLITIQEKLKAPSSEGQQQASNEVRAIAKVLRNRACERVGIHGLKTNLKVTGAVITIISLACPPAALGLTIAALPIAAISIACFVYAKNIPKDAVRPDEPRLFFATLSKGGRKLEKAIHNFTMKLQSKYIPQRA